MQNLIIPKLLEADVIILGTPVYFNNVSSLLKKFIDRTHCLIGHLCNKIGGDVVVGRKYGAEGAIIHWFVNYKSSERHRLSLMFML